MIRISWVKLATGALLLASTMSIVAKSKDVYLNKAFYHKGQLSDKIVFYFSEAPTYNRIPASSYGKENSSWEELRIFFPMVSCVSKDIKKKIASLSKGKNSSYELNCKEVMAPTKGVLVVVRYDPEEIVVEYPDSPFKAIGQVDAFFIALYQKKRLNDLNEKSGFLHKYAYNDKKKIRIVLDIGHGGEDHGKVGHFQLKEKNINLSVGMKTARLLTQKGYQVFLTRSNDQFVSLDGRTTFANTKVAADIFLSLHSNSGPTDTAHGIETFCVQSSCIPRKHEIGDRKTLGIISDFNNQRYQKSFFLAQSVQDHVLNSVRKQRTDVRDRKVKMAIPQVLFGTDMPSALLEMGFLSNEREAKLLGSPTYQNAVAQGICNGVFSYVDLVYRA